MPPNIARYKTIAISTISILACITTMSIVWYGFSLTATASPREQPANQTEPIITAATDPIEIPVHIAIPSIGVDALIEEVGLTTKGAMDVPKKSGDAGWYSLGTRPGNIGSAVIAGHLNSAHNAGAVFTNLSSIKAGDAIIVTGTDGISLTFIVRATRIYAADEDATDVFTSRDGIAHLNLITCAGTWDNVKKRNEERLVVFTDLQ